MLLQLLLASVPHLAPTVSPQEGKRYESDDFGLRLERPADWVTYGAKDQGEARFVLTVVPRGSKGNPSFVVYVYDWKEGTTLEAVRDVGETKLEASGVGDIERGSTKLGERDVLTLRGRKDDEKLGAYLVEYRFVASEPFLYALQLAAPPDDSITRTTLEAIASSLELFPAKLAEKDSDRERLEQLAARCGSEIEWATDWKSAAEAARESSKPILVLYENYQALDLPHTAASGLFMDEDLVALVRERFVAFRFGVGVDAPFRDPDVYGIGPNAWGTAVLFTDASGRVLRETSVHEPSYLCHLARSVLSTFVSGKNGRKSRERGDGSARDDPSLDGSADGDRLARAERHLRRGDLDRAEKDLRDDESAAGHRLRAAIHRQLRQGAEALEELRDARRVGDEALDRECDADEAVILMRTARHLEAREAFERIAAADPPSPRAPEAMFWLGAYEVLANSGEGERTWWRRLVDEHEDSRWAWKAAANLLDAGAMIRGGERLDWPSEEVLASATTPPPKPLSPATLDRAEKTAVDYLVETQREDGTWIVPADAFGIGPGLYTSAVTAICGTSLVPVAAKPGPASQGAEAAVRRALRRSLEAHESGALDSGDDLAGVYSIWGRTYVLGFLTECLRERIGDGDAIRAAMAGLVPSIEADQHVNGGWPYVFLPGDPTGESFDPSASFLTAAVVTILIEARGAGAEVSEKVLDRGLDFLASLRQEDGSYRYMRDLANGQIGDDFPEAAGRGPACAFALSRGERVELDEVRATLRTFLAHRTGFRKEWHKALCHTSPEGFGSHYLFFDYGFASKAVGALPREERRRYREAILEDVLGERFADGSFEDIPLLGRAYGTAMALLAFRELRGG